MLLGDAVSCSIARNILLPPDLTVSHDGIFVRSQLLKSHRSSGMQLLGADPDLCAESKLESIGKACGHIDIDTGCIHVP